MARVVLGSYFVRYPLGGMMSWILQYLVGLHRLGHEVCFVEKANYPDACYDPRRRIMTDDPTAGIAALETSFVRAGLDHPWCFVDFAGNYHGLDRPRVEQAFRDADVFFDMGTHGAWAEEAVASGLRVLVDGEPGFTQIKMARRLAAGETLPDYDHYCTCGGNIATGTSTAPTAGKRWRHLHTPVVTDLFRKAAATAPPDDAAFTTVMNWQAHALIEFEGREYGQKDREFWKFAELPGLTASRLELAVSGKNVPWPSLERLGWELRNAKEVTLSVSSFEQYIAASRGELSVCKQVFVALRTGWFSDRSAAYLASGRPVILQDTGFSQLLPCGEGLFAVDDAGEAVAALEEVHGDWPRQSQLALNLAREHLESERVLAALLEDLGV